MHSHHPCGCRAKGSHPWVAAPERALMHHQQQQLPFGHEQPHGGLPQADTAGGGHNGHTGAAALLRGSSQRSHGAGGGSGGALSVQQALAELQHREVTRRGPPPLRKLSPSSPKYPLSVLQGAKTHLRLDATTPLLRPNRLDQTTTTCSLHCTRAPRQLRQPRRARERRSTVCVCVCVCVRERERASSSLQETQRCD